MSKTINLINTLLFFSDFRFRTKNERIRYYKTLKYKTLVKMLLTKQKKLNYKLKTFRM